MKMHFINPGNSEIENVMEVTKRALPDWYTDNLNWEHIIAINDAGDFLGIISTSYFDNHITIEWLLVHPDYRRQGVATALLDNLFDRMTKNHFIVPVTFTFNDTQRGLKELFEKNPRVYIKPFGALYKIAPEDREKSKFYQQIKNRNDSIKAISVEAMEKSTLLRNIDYINSIGEYNITDFDIWYQEIDKKCSFVTVNKSQIVSCIFMLKNEDNTKEIAYLYGADTMALLEVLIAAIKAIDESYYDVSLLFEAVNDKSLEFVDKFFPSSEALAKNYTGNWNFTSILLFAMFE